MASPLGAMIRVRNQNQTAVGVHAPGSRAIWLLFLASFLALYFELVVIRYLATEIRSFAYLKNLPLVASFLGIGLGMILGRPPRTLKRLFPLLAAALFLVTANAPALALTHLPFPNVDYFVWGTFGNVGTPLVLAARYFGVLLSLLAAVVAFFVVLGGFVGEQLSRLRPLPGYGLNLLGSLAGIAGFTLLGIAGLPPSVWILIGFVAALPFFYRQRLTLLVFALVVVGIGSPGANTFWSPYYRIDLGELPRPPGWPQASAYKVIVNHDYHQRMLDLSAEFLAGHAEAEPNRSAISTYELPYWLVEQPEEVLVVGAGTGNDVAAALRHAAGHVDAVEIDPVILDLGRRYHPERPYASPRVTLHVNDARAFFRNSARRYDLIVFGYLDSHTLLSGFSALRLDNYVYTLESLQEARQLLREGGTFVLSFAGHTSFVSERLAAMLTEVFGREPVAYYTRYDGGGVVFVQGKGRDRKLPVRYPDIGRALLWRRQELALATDDWPFLYLSGRTIPISLLALLGFVLYGAKVVLRRSLKLTRVAYLEYLHLFFLGAGFLLLETRGVTELSLLFGSTWLVNALVIGAFLFMGLLANTLVMVRPVSRPLAYGALFALLLFGMVFPYSMLNSLSPAAKWLAAAGLVGLPVFFSGLIFSQSFRAVANPAHALGMNLLGAMVGGVLENAVMLGGIRLLGALAILVYGISALLMGEKRREMVISIFGPLRLRRGQAPG